MLSALSMPTRTPTEVALRDQAIAEARAQELAAAANRPVSAAVVTQVDSLLGLPSIDPTLGVTR
ncbi:hypothetical protein [Roseomonas rosulenta]|uniref:hypothetical protein n=1 Tax=Roseomonas rosulenta TaxID=2748667 RepID=UPI001E2F22A1|nr:hypothetical protein [Roseomonas rosulenta]